MSHDSPHEDAPTTSIEAIVLYLQVRDAEDSLDDCFYFNARWYAESGAADWASGVVERYHAQVQWIVRARELLVPWAETIVGYQLRCREMRLHLDANVSRDEPDIAHVGWYRRLGNWLRALVRPKIPRAVATFTARSSR